MHYSLRYADNDRQTGKSEANQQHSQEEEVGPGGSERTRSWTTVVYQWNLKISSWRSETQSFYRTIKILYTRKTENHLLDIEDKEVFNSADGRKHRAVEGADPADCLTVDNLQHILRNSKLLLSPPLGQGTITVPHY